jgi:protein-arginine kinase
MDEHVGFVTDEPLAVGTGLVARDLENLIRSDRSATSGM